MTDGFRCGQCEAILYTPAALASGDCGLHPRKHDFDPDENGDCQECGYPFTFGALHSQPMTEVPEPLEPVLCDGCAHEPHQPHSCRYVRVLHVGVQGRDVLHCTCEAAA